MKESPLERLNYFNGQRLEAADFRVEQEYHIRIQRLLSQALFTPGIAEGLEVLKVADDKGNLTKVAVQPGVALDDLGRAIVLLEAQTVTPNKSAGYVTIRYDEQKAQPEQDSCTTRDRVTGAARTANWGGPSRIVSTPKVSYRNDLPVDPRRELVLAQINLNAADCSIAAIVPSLRLYAGAAQADAVKGFALEGEKDIDYRNPKLLRFHIRGRRPNAVTLYLRGDQFSTLYYTELGQHNHMANANAATKTRPASPDASHSHELRTRSAPGDNLRTPSGSGVVISARSNQPSPIHGSPILVGQPGHSCKIAVFNDDAANAFSVNNPGTLSNFLLDDHAHVFLAVTGDVESASPSLTHSHELDLSAVAPAGVQPLATHGAAPRSADQWQLSHVNTLQISIGRIDKPMDEQSLLPCTPAICAQIQGQQPDQAGAWGTLGDGRDDHPLITQGTGPIRLDLLQVAGLDLFEGEYLVSIGVDPTIPNNGGKISYNLYIE